MPTLFRKTAQLAGEIRMAAADAITHTLRMVVASAPKVSGKVSLTNTRFEVIESYPMAVTNGTDAGTDVVAIRTYISGATLSEPAIKEAYDQHVLNVKAALNDGALKGFIPQVEMTAKP